MRACRREVPLFVCLIEGNGRMAQCMVHVCVYLLSDCKQISRHAKVLLLACQVCLHMRMRVLYKCMLIQSLLTACVCVSWVTDTAPLESMTVVLKATKC